MRDQEKAHFINFLAKNILKICKFEKNVVPLHRIYGKSSASCSGFSAVGSAHVWGARGRWFESSNPDRKESLRGLFKLLSGFFVFCFPRDNPVVFQYPRAIHMNEANWST